MRPIIAGLMALALAGLANAASAAAFNTTVSVAFAVPNAVTMVAATSPMNTDWFTQNAGGRTVYSGDVVTGALTHGTTAIMGHATWVINYTPATRTVNLNPGRTHVTSYYGNQRCQIYEDGTCNCHGAANWNICTYPAMRLYVTTLQASANAAVVEATVALQAAGYTVTRN
jgi:hypothetical protein